jgi:hypothetical protein
LSRSSKEAHVCTTDAIVRITDSTKKPLGNGSLSTVGREEVVENGSIERTDGSLTEVIVVGFNFRAAIVVRIFN